MRSGVQPGELQNCDYLVTGGSAAFNTSRLPVAKAGQPKIVGIRSTRIPQRQLLHLPKCQAVRY